MRKLYTLVMLFLCQQLWSQNNVGIGIATPNASAILDLTSTSQGFLVPRMGSAQRTAIATPATGLIVYDTDSSCAFFFTGSAWQNLCVSTGGGKIDSVFYNSNGTLTVVDGNGVSKTTTLSGWLTTGNQGTSSTTSFAGTTDAQDFVLKSNSSEVMRVTTAGAVGINQPAPNAGAVLDVTSTDKGVLVPRTTVGQITSPTLGLMIFDTDSNCFCFYGGAGWKNLCAASQNAWLLTGNSGTNSAVNFAGTTDAQDFVLRSNNTEVMRATQAGAVGINQPAPNANAILDIQSTSKGVIFPSLTTAQRDAIAGPAIGLTVYNNTLNVHQFWNGTCWVNVGQTVCSFAYTTSLSHPSDCLLRTNFNSVSDTVTVSLVSGTAAPVILSASGVPAGVLVNFSNSYVTPTATSVVTFTALPSAAIGTFTITILAASGSTIQTLTYTLTVYDYDLAVTPAFDTVNQLGFAPNHLTAVTTVSMANPGACGATNTTAILTVAGVPNGVTAAFGNSTLIVPGNTSLTFTSSSCAVVGNYTVTVIATLGAVQTTTNYTLVVAPSIMNITANANNINLWALAGSPNCPVNLTVNVAQGVTIGSASTTSPALNTGNFAGGSLITLNNAGIIAGAGGGGGNDSGVGLLATCPDVNGIAGGDAISLGSAGVTINNLTTGVIGGGGGGGGAGGSLNAANGCITGYDGTGGGGGAGSVPGVGGQAGGSSLNITPCAAGSNGTLNTGGNGGAITGCAVSCVLSFGSTYYPGQGGKGGNLGQAGQPGTSQQGITVLSGTGFCDPGNGGAAGCPVRANTYSYSVTGTALVGTPCP